MPDIGSPILKNLEAIQPPSNPPTTPTTMSPPHPKPPPFTTNPANQPAIKPTTIHEIIPILISNSLYDVILLRL
jgi:hypothetical protein